MFKRTLFIKTKHNKRFLGDNPIYEATKTTIKQKVATTQVVYVFVGGGGGEGEKRQGYIYIYL